MNRNLIAKVANFLLGRNVRSGSTAPAPIRRIQVFQAGNFYYIAADARNELGASSPIGLISKISIDESDLSIGMALEKALDESHSFVGELDWLSKRPEELAARKLGFKSFSDLKRQSLCVILDETKKGNFTFFSTRKRGTRPPNFEGISELVLFDVDNSAIGGALRKAFSDCS